MIYIKNCVSMIPGYEKGQEFGELVSTRVLLENMHNPEDRDFNLNFVEKRLGIKTVARTNATLDLMKKSLNDKRRSKKQYSFLLENESLKTMLIQTINMAFENDLEKDKVIAHIHLTGSAMTNHGYFLDEIRKCAGIANGKYIPTYFLIKGCSGIYDALLTSESLTMRSRRPVNILVTSDSNLQSTIGQSTIKHAQSNNINHWLYPAIFAEGVGCAVISNEKGDSHPSFRLDYSKADLITEENRVRGLSVNDELFCFIDAKGVSKTYPEGMAINVKRTLEFAESFSNLDAMLLHESNPKLLKAVVDKYNIPNNLVPSHSEKIGTLGPVSSFQLLEDAFIKCQNKNRKFTLNVIGELFSGVNAGCLGFTT